MWRFVPGLQNICNIVITQHLIVCNLHALLTSVSTGSKFFTIIDLCSAFFSIPADKANQYLFAFPWQERQYTWLCPKVLQSPSYFSQILKADLDDIIFCRLDFVTIHRLFASLLPFSNLFTRRRHPPVKTFGLGGPVVKNPLANAGDTGSISGPGRLHTPCSNWANVPQLLKPAL